ncbi:MAG: hypothetical protein PF574_03515 [Candidatus Delongbacteria bacterium]|jgi:uncharacterized protein YqfB (UPF0267 family)|nr:hypothetical protein [Candidatus Delongbacteria bacterium]
MIRLYPNKKYQFILLVGVTLLLTSCYSNYVHLSYDVEYSHPDPIYQFGDSNKVAFVSTQKAYLRATGISAFPDGGQVKFLYKKTGLYLYEIGRNKLTQLKDLTDSKDIPWYVRNRSELLFIDSLVYYYRKGAILDTKESKEALVIKQKYEKCYSININTKKINSVDTAKFNSLYKEHYKKKRADLSALKKIPLAEFDLIIQDIYPKSDEEYIEETIYLTSDGQTTRRAVIEQIISKLQKKEIKQLLKKMDDHSKTLEEYEKSKYDTYSKETYESIKSLL